MQLGAQMPVGGGGVMIARVILRQVTKACLTNEVGWYLGKYSRLSYQAASICRGRRQSVQAEVPNYNEM
jgi:hypothetical protein